MLESEQRKGEVNGMGIHRQRERGAGKDIPVFDKRGVGLARSSVPLNCQFLSAEAECSTPPSRVGRDIGGAPWRTPIA
jgi:hypothetical protein